MVPSERILASFLSDAVRLSAQAQECVSQLADQAMQNRVSPAQVRSLFQCIHTLKGTASMVEGCEAVVKALEEIESLLSRQSVVDSARRHQWIALARSSVAEAHEQLNRLQSRERFQTPGPEPLVQGLMVRARLEGTERILWFPLSCLTQVLAPDEMNGADGAIRLQGRWIPMVGEGRFGLLIKAAAGEAVLRVEEIRGVTAWSAAAREGANSGLEIFASKAA